jgi:NAD-dependent dihydropyrimidine dehydrogenase PreA subunit
MYKIKLNNEKCTGCKLCYHACFIDVIRWDDINNQPILSYEEDCVQCNFCEISCPCQCIVVETA